MTYEKTDRGDDAAAAEGASDPSDAPAPSFHDEAGTEMPLSKETIVLHRGCTFEGKWNP